MFPCMTGVDFEELCSLLAETYNIEIWKNSLYFIMGIFRCHGNVRYVDLIDAIFCKVHSIGPSNMCINFEKNRLIIDDFRKSEKNRMFSLTSRSAKTWRHMSKPRVAFRSAIIQGTFFNQSEVSTTSGSKVMAHYVKFTKVVTLTLTLIRFWPNNFARVLRVESICCQNFRKIGPVMWPVERSRTDKHTNNQTDRQTVVTNILCKNLRFCKVMKG